MGKWEVVEQILEYIPDIDFNTTTTEVSLFETTIRYLGGLVSGKTWGCACGIIFSNAPNSV